MARFNLDDLLAKCGPAVRALNPEVFSPGHKGKGDPVVEHSPGNGPLAAPPPQAFHSGKYFVRIVSFRVILLDEDNLCEKFCIDTLRYAGAIPADSPDRCRIITTQEKVAHREEERTEVTVTVDDF